MVRHTIWYLQSVTRNSDNFIPRTHDVEGSDGGPVTITFRRRRVSEYGATVIVVTHPDAPGWDLSVELTAAGQAVGYALSAPLALVWPAGPEFPREVRAGGITARRIREVPWLQVERGARYFAKLAAAFDLADATATAQFLNDDGQVIEEQRLHPEKDSIEAARRLRAFRDTPADRTITRANERSELDLARIARTYANESTGRPVAAVATAQSISESAARNVVSRARQRGLLSAGQRGRASGQLTDKARQLLLDAGEPVT